MMTLWLDGKGVILAEQLSLTLINHIIIEVAKGLSEDSWLTVLAIINLTLWTIKLLLLLDLHIWTLEHVAGVVCVNNFQWS